MAEELEKYREKRHFERTSEPPPRVEKGAGPLMFVIQKHRATRLHYDLRLEVDGVLKSWAVPKGPPIDPQAKHLAVRVEDHPLDYAGFEGVIPKGEYGAGEVIVWDNGTYAPGEGEGLPFNDRAAAEEEMRRGLEKGKLSFFLSGHKLKGSFTLVKLKGKEKDWLFMKHRDEYAVPGGDITTEGKSVISGYTVEDVRATGAPGPLAAAKPDISHVVGARPAPFPSTVPPMLASLAEGPFSRPDWIFEPKLDGYRTIALIREGKVTLLSRRGNNVTEQYAALVPDLSRQQASELVLDGEIISMDEKGRQCFQCLQNYLSAVGKGKKEAASEYSLIYYVFDILYLDGYDLRGSSLHSRKELLQRTLIPSNHVRLIDFFEKDGELVYEAALQNGMEGAIGKRSDSIYESGKRSRNWLKIKPTLSEEFIIGGYTVSPEGRAQTFSSLALGYFNNEGKLTYAGNVGSGFDEDTLKDIKERLDVIRSDKCPFSEIPTFAFPVTWVRPEIVAEIKFNEWTQDGRLRIPVFVRLREDKAADEIRKAGPGIVLTKPEETKNPDDAVLEQLQNPKAEFTIDVEGQKVGLTSMDKLLWPATSGFPGFTKRDFLVYLARVAPYMLPHLKDRPLTLTRYPDGINGEHFFQKHWGHPVPAFVEKVNISEEKGVKREYLLCSNVATLLWLGQVANLEFHTWFSRVNEWPDMAKGRDTDYLLDYPDFIIFDLDAYIYSGREAAGAEPEMNRAGFAMTCDIALKLKETLSGLSLNAFVKTSGKTGLHIYAPVIRVLDYKATRLAAETVGRFLVTKYPHDVTIEWAPEKRTGKVFVDYNQNVRGKTLASLYSPRPTPEGTVSTPLRWEELGKVYPTDFTLATVPDRLKVTGDLWADILAAKKDLGKLLKLE